MADEYASITLTDDEGQTTEFDILDTLDYEGERYVVVAPSEGEGDQEDDLEEPGDGEAAPMDDADDPFDDEDAVEVVILRLVGEGDDEYYETVDDDGKLDALFEMFHDRHVGEYDFE